MVLLQSDLTLGFQETLGGQLADQDWGLQLADALATLFLLAGVCGSLVRWGVLADHGNRVLRNRRLPYLLHFPAAAW